MRPFYHIISLSFFLLFLFLLPEAKGQQTSQMSSFVYHPEFYNPAANGNSQIALVYRRQWLSFDSGIAPSTFALYSDLSGFLPFKERVGLGLSVRSGKAHIFNRTNVNLSFAFHLINIEDHRFSLGMIAGFMNQRIDFGDIQVSSLSDIALYDGSGAMGVFDGGPGLYYAFDQGDNAFSLSLALPQLFTSDLQYTDGIVQNFDNRFHLLAGLRYKANLGAISLEPNLLIRGVNGTESVLVKNTVDLNLRAFFLDDQFWVSGGARLNGNTLLAGLGVKVADKFHLEGIFEYHNSLGANLELTAAYRFDDKIPDHLLPFLNDLERERSDLLTVNEKLDQSKLSRVRSYLASAERSFDQAASGNLSESDKINKINEADRHMGQAKDLLDELFFNAQSAFSSVWAAERIVADAKRQNISDREIDEDYEVILEEGRIINNTIKQLNREYTNVNNLITNYKLQTRIEEPIIQLMQQEDLSAIGAKLKADLNRTPGISPNTMVQVDDGEQISIVYTFPYTENIYQLGEWKDARTILIDHIYDQIESLDRNRIQVQAINMEMRFQDEIPEMQATQSPDPYMGEFGEILPLSVNLRDTDNETDTNTTRRIELWDSLNFADLACLKMEGIKRHLQNSGLRRSTDFSFEISGPNYDEERSQVMAIQIVIQD